MSGNKNRLLYWPKFFLDHSSTSFAFFSQPGITKDPKPSVCSWFSLRHPVSNWLKPSGHLVILFSNVHLRPLFFRLFTLVHLLIDGSVEGQYIRQFYFKQFSLALLHCSDLFNSYIRSDDNEGVLRIPKTPHYRSLTIRLFYYHIQDARCVGVLTVCRELVGYSTVPIDWARYAINRRIQINHDLTMTSQP